MSKSKSKRKDNKKKGKQNKVQKGRAVPSQNFLRGVKEEIKKVTWPTREKTLKLSFVVIAISLIIGFYLGIIDVLLTKILESISR